jgi:protein TonB
VKDPVDRVIVERQALEHGFSKSLWMSLWIHLGVVGAGLAAPFVLPRTPPIQVQDGFAVTLPRGGGGVPDAPAPKPKPAKAEPEPKKEPEPVKDPPPKPKFKPPPTKTKPKREGLPAPDARKSRRKPRATPEPAGGGVQGGTGAGSVTPGLEFAPAGPGVPGGTDEHGDWYLAGVQRKIWMLWRQQIQAGQARAVAVRFTILRDGSVTDLRVVQKSGATLLDLAAQRAVLAAAPFGPFPSHYGMSRVTIQANFKPNP